MMYVGYVVEVVSTFKIHKIVTFVTAVLYNTTGNLMMLIY